jgi:hypothetical protein
VTSDSARSSAVGLSDAQRVQFKAAYKSTADFDMLLLYT